VFWRHQDSPVDDAVDRWQLTARPGAPGIEHLSPPILVLALEGLTCFELRPDLRSSRRARDLLSA
jgi:hypothetical protein